MKHIQRHGADEDWRSADIEHEMDPSLVKDIDLLLHKSRRTRAVKDELERTRQLIKSADDIALPEDARVYDRMHAKIMAAINENEEPSQSGMVPEKAGWTGVRVNLFAKR